MGLKATIARAVKQAMLALDDIPKVCTYKSVSGGAVRNHAAGTSARTETDYPLPQVVFTKFSEKDIDRDPALLTDMRMIFPTADLPVQPKQSDTVVDSDAITWAIVRRLSDPASVVTILQVRTS
jgi:hypothetical protein